MAERTVRTDIIIAIHPKHVSNIVSRVKDHEYRKYLIPSSVLRIWIYETSPASAIKYVAQISPGKRPGEITNSLGLRNAEFNEGKLEHIVKYAYEIQNLLATPSPWTLQDLKAKGWLNGPPQKYCYVKESMMAALHNISLVKVFDSLTSPDVCDRDLGEVPGNNCGSSDERLLETKVVKSEGRCLAFILSGYSS
jgi:predicted transcriptional regulator